MAHALDIATHVEDAGDPSLYEYISEVPFLPPSLFTERRVRIKVVSDAGMCLIFHLHLIRIVIIPERTRNPTPCVPVKSPTQRGLFAREP